MAPARYSCSCNTARSYHIAGESQFRGYSRRNPAASAGDNTETTATSGLNVTMDVTVVMEVQKINTQTPQSNVYTLLGGDDFTYIQAEFGSGAGVSQDQIQVLLGDSANSATVTVAAAWSTSHTITLSKTAAQTMTVSLDGVTIIGPIATMNWVSTTSVLVGGTEDATPATALTRLQISGFYNDPIMNFSAVKSGNNVVATWTTYARASSYKVSVDGGVFGTTGIVGTTYTGTSQASTNHTYVVQAFDGSGNVMADATAYYLVGAVQVIRSRFRRELRRKLARQYLPS